MFVLSRKMVKEVIKGQKNYNDLPYDKENEVVKGYRFRDQARVNLALANKYVPMCRALDEPCQKETCLLFVNKGGDIQNGWVCREYQLDFPQAVFDSRFHVGFIGVDKVDPEVTKEHLGELENAGGKYICLGCSRVYTVKPREEYEDGHGGRYIEMCMCGSDLFDELSKVLGKLGQR